MDVTIATVILIIGFAAESFIVNRARERAEGEDVVVARLARYAGRQLQQGIE
jgi:hypothetical protein